ncbi:CRISPR-associated helicase Cas3' [Paenibacillus lutrae]|uniref:CRISPR-associated helicase Cas3 n=1 Tax=Paenibacillus lutrae TaxID=2078573 RepID=A0A7X3FIL5_9BACL|nr:CRISPR-associated helicase Cas3' [Paenibacillus lutrae]MVP00466.1 CRISPR-associated helicase Cas3' [Paenibacillus lutrae]
MNYIAHIRESDEEQQSVEEHLLGVQSLAEDFGAGIGLKHICGLAGLLHDMGKYTSAFRNYILEAVYNPEAPPKRGSVDHSTAGGRLLYETYHTVKINRFKGILAEIIGNAIISHHSYLQDFLNPELESNYLQRVRDKELTEFDQSVALFFQKVMSKEDFHLYVDRASEELEGYLAKSSSMGMEARCMFLTKFVFSTLIDADRTNTRKFEENAAEEPVQPVEELFDTYYKRLLDEIGRFGDPNKTLSSINRLRSEMSEQCDRFAEKPSGIYTLSIPTGGGKTLASLRYALKHARKYGKRHIIYVLPYTTIIEQNAAEVRRILLDEANILEHHSNVIDDIDGDDEHMDGMINVRQKLKLARDNWDVPIIFTTMVQFLNVFYAKGSRNIRRLHNLSSSVLVFDEVQKVPVSCVSLFNEALNFLRTYGNASLVLCTATQPALDFVEHKLNLSPDAEMIDNLHDVITAFTRVEILDRATTESFNNDKLTEFITEIIEEKRSVLAILNTKSVVKKLYQQLLTTVSNVPIYHLSTSMCAVHRKEILEEVRDLLKKGEKVICVSTPLIEAGVDVSFGCVIRSLAGLDSIAQAAGRCNRHGEHERQQVYVIDHEEENLDRLKEVKEGKRISQQILIDLKRDSSEHGGHILSVQAMERYFQRFYKKFELDLNYQIPKLGQGMTRLLFATKEENTYCHDYYSNTKERIPLFLANSYLTAAEHFHVIDSATKAVIVPYQEEGKAIIAELNGARRIEELSRLLRKAQQYTINLFDYELQQLDKNGGLERCLDGQMLVLNERAYSKEFGVDTTNDSSLDMNLF